MYVCVMSIYVFKGRQKLSTGEGVLGDSQFLKLKDTARTLVGRKVWPGQIAYCRWYIPVIL